MPGTQGLVERDPRLLIIDGTPLMDTPIGSATSGIGPLITDCLESLWPGCDPAVLRADRDGQFADLPGGSAAEAWDGVFWAADGVSTCDCSADALDAALSLMEVFFSAGIPQFGTGWGLHVATLCSGGEVIPQAHPSFPLARKIHLTQCGVTHPLFVGRSLVFDAPSLHPDGIESLPAEAVLLAQRHGGDVQAVEVPYINGSFWGLQYQPEYDLREIAAFCQRHGADLIEAGWFADSGHVATYGRRCIECQMTPRRDLQMALGVDDDVLDDSLRQHEVAQWLNRAVVPHLANRQPVQDRD